MKSQVLSLDRKVVRLVAMRDCGCGAELGIAGRRISGGREFHSFGMAWE